MKRMLVVMLLMAASSAQADVFTWTDVRGVAHYTNKEYEIPKRYKARAKALHIEAVQAGGASAPQQAAPPQPVPQPQETPATPQVAPSNPAPQPAVTAPGTQPPSGQTPPLGGRGIRSGNE